MAATFPGGVKVFTTKQAGDQIASAHINDLQDEVVAVETELRKTTGSVVSHGSLAGLNNNDHPQYVLMSGDQTVAGVKTFSSFPVTPSSAPSSNYQTANKKYVDDLIGAWASWTPTVTYLGGTTDPKSLTVDHARYCRTGDTVTFSIVATVERGSGNRTVVAFSLPLTAKYADFAASGTEDVTSTIPKACGCYSDNAKRVLVRFATAMANDGKIRVSGSYEVGDE